MKVVFKIIHYTIEIGLSIWWGIHTQSWFRGYVFLALWETTVMLIVALVAILILAANHHES